MNALQHFFESGLVVEIAIGLILLEMIAVLWRRRKAGFAVLLGLIPGLCLMLALLTVLKGGDWRVTALLVTVSLPFHLIDLRFRLHK